MTVKMRISVILAFHLVQLFVLLTNFINCMENFDDQGFNELNNEIILQENESIQNENIGSNSLNSYQIELNANTGDVEIKLNLGESFGDTSVDIGDHLENSQTDNVQTYESTDEINIVEDSINDLSILGQLSSDLNEEEIGDVNIANESSQGNENSSRVHVNGPIAPPTLTTTVEPIETPDTSESVTTDNTSIPGSSDLSTTSSAATDKTTSEEVTQTQATETTTTTTLDTTPTTTVMTSEEQTSNSASTQPGNNNEGTDTESGTVDGTTSTTASPTTEQISTEATVQVTSTTTIHPGLIAGAVLGGIGGLAGLGVLAGLGAESRKKKLKEKYISQRLTGGKVEKTPSFRGSVSYFGESDVKKPVNADVSLQLPMALQQTMVPVILPIIQTVASEKSAVNPGTAIVNLRQEPQSIPGFKIEGSEYYSVSDISFFDD